MFVMCLNNKCILFLVFLDELVFIILLVVFLEFIRLVKKGVGFVIIDSC